MRQFRQPQALEGVFYGVQRDLYVACPAHFQYQPSAGGQCLRYARKYGGQRFHPVQRGVAEDRAELLSERELVSVLNLEAHPRMTGPGRPDHAGRRIDAQDLGPTGGHLGAQFARAAAQVEDALARLRGQPVVHQILAAVKYEGVTLAVLLRVPDGWLHASILEPHENERPCCDLAEVQSGTLMAANHQWGGAAFTLNLPPG